MSDDTRDPMAGRGWEPLLCGDYLPCHICGRSGWRFGVRVKIGVLVGLSSRNAGTLSLAICRPCLTLLEDSVRMPLEGQPHV